ncbi:MAG: methionine--tRNA ligase [Candidatus Nomurabacteria bacterium]|nr:MAG: methionine--tRNA ligase [Candidatus Nomurabacteria bacterium]HRV75870.1 methionine--tRNA ligase [Candidatus Saccharimonadales bacterium]
MTKFYITTTIPYVNGDLHLGHAQEFAEADTLARYYRSKGDEVLFSAGTDENGEKNFEVAQKSGITPQQYVDSMLPNVLAVHKAYNISADRFIRTSDEAHHARVQIAWTKLKPYIFKSKYIGYYCVGCEEFKTETDFKENNGVCPDHNRKYEMREEENYFFKLSDFGERITEAINSEEMRVVPDSKKNEILSLIKSGLDDLSVSRPKSKLAWGVEVPDDPEHTIYIWFEALLNYITLIGYPEHEDFKKFWPADLQVLGKGVLRQHAAIWPAILMGLGLPLPKNLFVHGYVSVNGKKMSKSLGNSVDPLYLAKLFGTDGARYFLLSSIPSYSDGDFTWQKMLNVYNNDLINGLGNVIQRTSMMIGKYLNGEIGDKVPGSRHDHTVYHEALSDYRFDKALEWVFGIVDGVNKYLEQTKPWMLAKDESNKEHVREILLTCVADLREVSALLAPFMPQTAEMINSVFGGSVLNPPQGPVFARVELPGELTAQGAV